MKSIILLGLTSLFTSFAFAGANVQLNVSAISRVITYDRASNHPGYSEILISGVLSQSDAAVKGLPEPLPQTIRLLYPSGKSTFKDCLDHARLAATNGSSFTLHLFMIDPNLLPKKIEGGMVDNQFNQFVIKSDDVHFSQIGCELRPASAPRKAGKGRSFKQEGGSSEARSHVELIN